MILLRWTLLCLLLLLLLLLLPGSWSFPTPWPAKTIRQKLGSNGPLVIPSAVGICQGSRERQNGRCPERSSSSSIGMSASRQASLPSGANSSSSGDSSSSSSEGSSPDKHNNNRNSTHKDPPKKRVPETVLLAEVRELRARAQQLKAEALAEEAALGTARSSRRDRRLQECDGLVGRLFTSSTNTSSSKGIETSGSLDANATQHVADMLRKEGWSPPQVVMVLERLQERQNGLLLMQQQQPAVISMDENSIRNNATEEWAVLEGQILSLIQAAGTLDDEYAASAARAKKNNITDDRTVASHNSTIASSRWTGRVEAALKTRRKEMLRALEEDVKRKVAAAIFNSSNNNNNNAVTSGTTTSPDAIMLDEIQENLQRIARKIPVIQGNGGGGGGGGGGDNNNATGGLGRVSSVPFWVPPSLLPFLAESRATIRKEDVALIQDRVLVGTRFFCTSSDSIPSAAIFRGNLRTPGEATTTTTTMGPKDKMRRSNHTAAVLEEIQLRLEAQGIAERVQLFLMDDPEWRPGARNDNQKLTTPLPVILAISKKVKPTENAMEKATTSVLGKVSSNFFSCGHAIQVIFKNCSLSPSCTHIGGI